MTKTQLIAEILTDLRQYDEAGLIDYRSLDLWITNQLKRFGNDIMVMTEKVIKVNNREAILPEDFWKLELAARCNKTSYCVKEGDVDEIVGSHYWTHRIENTYEWNNQANTHKKTDFKEIVEIEHYHNQSVEFRYEIEPTLLTLTRGYNRALCTDNCKNISSKTTKSQSHQINILNNKIQTNFNDSDIYVQYLSLPKNSEQELLIESSNGSLEDFIQYYCKRKVLESLLLNGDDNNVGQKLQLMKQLEDDAYSRAKTTIKFDSLGSDWHKKIQNRNRAVTLKYERLFPNK